MSLEKALEANTAATLALTESINRFIVGAAEAESRMRAGMPPALTPIDPSSTCGVTAPKKQEEKVSAPSKAKTAPAAENPPLTHDTTKPSEGTSTPLAYDDIKTPFLELAKRDLAAAQALIAEFGFKTLKDAKPEQYAEILGRLSAADIEKGMA